MEDLTGIKINGYEIKQRLAQGGFGAVYKAFQASIQRDVAIKVILPELANEPSFIRRFEAEAQLIARFENPHIVPLYDYWRDPSGAYLVMRYLRNGSLRDYLHMHRQLDIEEAVQLFTQIAQGLSMAHRHQVVHRDIKPSNILMDEDGNAYVADFGIAKDQMLSKGITEPDTILGSPKYLAPEQARSEPVSPQTDIYSLGVILYEMLKGEHPFPEMNNVAILIKHLNDPLPVIKELDSSIQESVNKVIQKATSKKPLHRYDSVSNMLSDLRTAARLDITPTPESLVELLTPREQEVMQLIIDGKSNREIADTLVLAVGTIKQYISSIYKKLKVRSRVQAIARTREFDFVVKRPKTSSSLHLNEPQPENPYKGLRAFQAGDAQQFFGREKLTHKLLARMDGTDPECRFLAIVGASGSGKSSIVRAGVIPELWKGQIRGSENWYVVEMMPGTRPIDELEISLLRIANNTNLNIREQLNRDADGLSRAVNLILPDDGSELLIFIDQFEEVFTLIDNEESRQQFLTLLYAALTDKRSRVRIIITLRADYYDRPLTYTDFGSLLEKQTEILLPMSAEELERVIMIPASQVGVTFEDGLVSRIVSEALYQPGSLPLLQYALTELFERQDTLQLTISAYEELGGTAGALTKRADEIYLEGDETHRELIRQLFLRLVQFDDGKADMRRRMYLYELNSLTEYLDVLDEIIDSFTKSRLLSLDNDPTTREPTVEVSHEALIRKWSRLEQWIEQAHEDLKIRRRLSAATTEWLDSKEDSGLLARDTRLIQFENWIQHTDLLLSDNEKKFINESLYARKHRLKVEDERQANEARIAKRVTNFQRASLLLGSTALVAIISVIASLIAFFDARNEFQNASTQVAEANRVVTQSAQIQQDTVNFASSVEMAIRAQTVNLQDPPSAISIALTANSIALAQESEYILSTVAYPPGAHRMLLQEQGGIASIDYSPDGTQVLVVWCSDLYSGPTHIDYFDCDDGHTLLLDAYTGEVIQNFDDLTNTARTAIFNNDGQMILIGDQSGHIHVVELATGNIANTFVQDYAVRELEISPDGQQLLSVAGELNAIDMSSGEILWRRRDILPLSVKFTTDGETVLVGTVMSDLYLIGLDATTGNRTLYTYFHQAPVFSMDVSPDGQSVVSTSFTEALHWDLNTGELIYALDTPIDSVNSVQFTPDGNGIISASYDTSITWYDRLTGNIIHTFRGHHSVTNAIGISPDNRYLISGGCMEEIDFTCAYSELMLWDLYDGSVASKFNISDNPIHIFAQSSDGEIFSVGTTGGEVFIADTSDGDILQEFTVEPYILHNISFSQTNEVIAYVSHSSSNNYLPIFVTLYDVEAGKETHKFEISSDAISGWFDVVLHLDTMRLFITRDDGSIAMWHLDDDIINEPDMVYQVGTNGSDQQVVFDLAPDGTLFLAETSEGSISLWDVQSGEPLLTFVGNQQPITNANFSADGTFIISGSRAGEIIQWSTTSGEIVRSYQGATLGITSLTLDTHNSLLGAGISDGTILIWDTATGVLLRRFRETAPVCCLAFSPDSQYLYTTSQDVLWRKPGEIFKWHLHDRSELLQWVADNRWIPDSSQNR